MLLLIASVVVGASLLFLISKASSPKIGIYSMPGRWYWLKKGIFYVMLLARKRKNKKSGSVVGDRGYGQAQDDYAEMDTMQVLSPDPYAIDSIFFGGFCKDGTKLVMRLARRHGRSAEIWLFLDLPGIGQFQHPVHPDTDVYNTDGQSFSAGGITFELLEPMRRWKVTYCGILRVGLCNDIETKAENYVQARFSFIWDAYCDPFNFDSDINQSTLIDAIAQESWTKNFWSNLKSKHQTHYEQWGELRGNIHIEGHPTQHVTLKCVRDHSYGVRDWADFHRYVIHYISLDSGVSIQVGVVSHPDTMSHLIVGYLVYPLGDIVSVSDVSFKLWEIGDEGSPPNEYKFTFSADNQTYQVNVRTGLTPVWYHHSDRRGKVMECFADYTVNGLKGQGLVEFFYRSAEGPSYVQEQSVRMLTEPSDQDVGAYRDKYVLQFSHPMCASSALVGGKGSQLALLTHIQKELDVTVPTGMCVTLSAFNKQLQEFHSLTESIDTLISAIRSKKLEGLPDLCDKTVKTFTDASISNDIETVIIDSLSEVFGESYCDKRFAVRSSAAGEDGCEASSAGQMETFLGVQGRNAILDSIRKCWASAYTFQAVEYRRQHGQPINSSVGVVIQEMVPSEVSGVLFTADPSTGNSYNLTLNANFGLGESVVSGKADPDTFSVRRHWRKDLEITERNIGSKNIIMVMAGQTGIEEVNVNNDPGRSSLTDEEIFKLCKVGIELEKYFGNSRDIEWALAAGHVFLLQSRPITTVGQESDEELIHEFDTPLSADYDLMTTGNIGEMMPYAVTPLTRSTFLPAVSCALQAMNYKCGARLMNTKVIKACGSCCNHLFISMHTVASMFVRVAGTDKNVSELAVLGMTLPDLKVEEIRQYVGSKASLLTRYINFYYMIRGLSNSYELTKEWEVRLKTYAVGNGCDTATSLYEEINTKLPDYYDIWSCTIGNSAKSGSTAVIMMSILTSGANEWKTEHYGDLAILLSNCSDVFSADVPTKIQEVAKTILEEGLEDIFANSTNEECVNILKSKDTQRLYETFQMFLDRHGHRCVREAELREQSWQSDPRKLIDILKVILKTKSYEQREKVVQPVSQIIANLKSNLTWIKRLILKMTLPKARKAVGDREWGKSISIVMTEKFKQSYWRLAHMLVYEGRLPDHDLLFFLTHQEIGQLIATRSARLITKAMRRKRIHSTQMGFVFPKLNIGKPAYIVDIDSEEDVQEPTAILKGMPVSQGKVKGRARVITSLADATLIQVGEILIVPYTDVGWTPYFPLIAGLITEIGGLLSHGAVVAREYGIPCIVNVPRATKQIQTGDLVQMNGIEGTVEKLAG